MKNETNNQSEQKDAKETKPEEKAPVTWEVIGNTVYEVTCGGSHRRVVCVADTPENAVRFCAVPDLVLAIKEYLAAPDGISGSKHSMLAFNLEVAITKAEGRAH